mmetsp:Transcript_36783/g.102075  ORF Transcript_36783/g.102075 Transcript_36783/m.102075 type:complete len:268 (+) Transcript_36783:393-1196(+)
MMRFVANTTEFGGVAAGSMKAKEQATVAGNINKRGCVRVSVATDARMGNMMFAVAVFDVTSVRKQRMSVMRYVSRKLLMPTAPANCSPTNRVNCESRKPCAIAKPPPMRMSTPHGKCDCAMSQLSTVSPGRFTDGTKNKMAAAAHAMVASLTPLMPMADGLLMRSLRASQPMICSSCTTATTTWSRLRGPRALYSANSTSRFNSSCTPRTKMRYTTKKASKTDSKLTGAAKRNQSWALTMLLTSGIPISTPLGIVPILVAMPPEVAL